MKKIIRLLFKLVCLVFVTTPANALIVTYEFSGNVSHIYDIYQDKTLANIGDIFSGSVTLDTELGSGVFNNTGNSYTHYWNADSLFSLTMESGSYAGYTFIPDASHNTLQWFSNNTGSSYFNVGNSWFGDSYDQLIGFTLPGGPTTISPSQLADIPTRDVDRRTNELTYFDNKYETFGYHWTGDITDFKRVHLIIPLNDSTEILSVEGKKSLDKIIQDYINKNRTETRLGIQVGNRMREGVKILKVGDKIYFDIIPEAFGIEVDPMADNVDSALHQLEVLGEALIECGETNGDCNVTLVSHSPAMVVSETILDDLYSGISFEFLLEGLDDDDYLIVAIDDNVIFSIPGSEFENNHWYNTNFIDFGDYAGNGGIFSIGLLTDESDRSVKLRNFAFYSDAVDSISVPEPSMIALMVTGILGLGIARRRKLKP